MEYVSVRTSKPKFNILERVANSIRGTQTFNIRVKTDILYRTELMCMSISEQIKCEFGVEDLIDMLYMDFMKYAIKNYNPERVLREVSLKNKNLDEDFEVKIISNGEEKVYKSINVNYSTISYRMENNEVRKGELVLRELYSLYKVKIPFESLVSNLWTNFIEDYKVGKNKRAYSSVVKLLK